ncbi:hypothetical protein FGO68_gene11134 [Halteria grandinella]|uniref:Uncharacterized protein n=1 Tax=Halteria grandinella TaxID=5974 RepID=A0A8J8NT09_HALGN|nr:hypothetical protein FGO68_gene11134 [Halteria grandinella]
MTLQMIIQQQENMELCSCGSEEKVMFHCDYRACPFYQVQKLYCHECMVPEKHDHRPGLIAKKSKNMTDEWNKLRQDISKLRSSCTQWMQINEPLVKILDKHLPNPEKSMLFKFNQLEELNTHVEEYFQHNVAEISAKGEIIKLEQLNPSLNTFRERLQELEPLRFVGPSVLWEVYQEEFSKVRYQEVLEKLSQANIETFIKLKLRRVLVSLNEVLRKFQLVEYNQQEYLENPQLSIHEIVQKINQQVQNLANNIPQLDSEQIKVELIRSELDTIGVSLMLSELKSQVVNNLLS